MDADMSGQAGFLQITITIDPSNTELVTDFLACEAPSGFQEIDSLDANASMLRFYLEEPLVGQFQTRWKTFYREKLSRTAPDLETEFVADIDWQERFRRETQAVIVADSILVRPTWIERDSVGASEITTDIVIDPKMAFGVGSHETTQLAMCALKDNVRPGMRVADVGCGSLILSILAAKLGASYVKAVDNDPVAIENSEENRRLNNVAEIVEIGLGSTEMFSSEKRSYDIVVANIITAKLLAILDDLVQMVTDSGTLILSGIIKQDAPIVESALRELSVTNWSQTRDGEWICYTCSPVAG